MAKKTFISEIHQDIVITLVKSVSESGSLNAQNEWSTSRCIEPGDHIHGIYQISWPKSSQKYHNEQIIQRLYNNICIYFSVVENGKFHQEYQTHEESAMVHYGKVLENTDQRVSWIFPFEIKIPLIDDFPSSFSSSHASIRHGLFAKINNLGNLIHLPKKDFTIFEKSIVISFLKSSTMFNEYSRPYSRRDQQIISTSRGGGMLFTMIKINKRSFHPGEQIHLTFQLRNESRILINTTHIRLVRVIKHYQSSPDRKKHMKSYSKTKLISSEKKEASAIDKSLTPSLGGLCYENIINSLNEWNIIFTLPSNIHVTSIGTSVHLEYYLKISLCTKSFRCESTVVPICVIYSSNQLDNTKINDDVLSKFSRINMTPEIQIDDDEPYKNEVIDECDTCISDDDPRSILSDDCRESNSSIVEHVPDQSVGCNQESIIDHSISSYTPWLKCNSGQRSLSPSPCPHIHSKDSSQDASLFSIEG